MLFLLWTTLLAICHGSAIDPRRKPSAVTVINEVEGGPKLMVHCKSKDDDIGVHILPPHQNIRWGFRPDFFGRTLFFCAMDWGEGLHWFDIYVESRDYDRCKDCRWLIKKGGPCLTNPERDSCHYWNKKKYVVERRE
ncbi:unnamed protein product [Linum tenue]|uniref:S-protein homolog n=2 Tax=Linum tenue TaxID=586396 RepID=A0AAV0HD38_9ROSI|nr:unnamed protein product [Linum tenue]